jgi:predicted lipoprotein with Yx(FWY)xxD motif
MPHPDTSRPYRAAVRRRRDRTIGLAVAAAAALAVAGCAGAEPESGDPAVSGPPKVATGIRVVDVQPVGKVLVDSRGMAVYVNNADTLRALRCTGTCEQTWRPVEVSGDAVPAKIGGVNGTFSVVERPDGTNQLALTGHPLYTYAKDTKKGSIGGNWTTETLRGTKVTWHVVTATGALPTHSASPTATTEPGN